MEDFRREEFWMSYVAETNHVTQSLLVKILTGNDNDMPSYVEIIRPETQDNKTAKEIVDETLKKLIG